MRNDGGQAFPSPAIRNDAGQFIIKPQTGMTLRDYFAAHAPEEPHGWFEPTVSACPPDNWVSDDGKVQFQSLKEAMEALGEEGPYSNTNHDAQAKWGTEKRRQRLLQWPYAWADEQIKQRYRAVPVLTEEAVKA